MILVLNGSPRGARSNCQVLIGNLIRRMKRFPEWKGRQSVKVVHLSEITWTQAETKRLFADLKVASGFVFTTGTYWDSWGSPLQIFLEHATALEGGPAFMGKPAIVLVLNHSVGGKEVLSRLQGVLSTMGCLIPPMSGMVYAWVSDQLFKTKLAGEAQKDLWSLDDLDQILENLNQILKVKINWATWPLDQKDFKKVWLK